MYSVELYERIRRACHVEEIKIREAARVFGMHRGTVRKALKFSVGAAGHRRLAASKLDGFTRIIDRILEADRSTPRKQRHASKRVFERMRDEHGFQGGYTGLCAGAETGPARGVHTAGAPVGPRPGLRQGVGEDRRGRAEG